MTTLDTIRKLCAFKPISKQRWVVATFILNTGTSEPRAFWIFIAAFHDIEDAKQKCQEVIMVTGYASVYVFPACKLFPITPNVSEFLKEGQTVDVNLNEHHELLSITENIDKQQENKRQEALEHQSFLDKDQETLKDPTSIASLARHWYRFIKYKEIEIELKQQLTDLQAKIIDEYAHINQNKGRTEEVVAYLDEFLVRNKETDLLLFMKGKIKVYDAV